MKRMGNATRAGLGSSICSIVLVITGGVYVEYSNLVGS